MNTKRIVIGAIVLMVLLFVAMLHPVFRKPAPDFTVRHIKSARTGNITTMTFEITNYTGNSYIFFPYELQIRTGNGWSKFQSFERQRPPPLPQLAPLGGASYTIDVTNLPDRSVVRFCIRIQEDLLGFKGFVRRGELRLRDRRMGRPPGQISLDPYDKNSHVFGKPIELESEEWVEAGK